MTPAGVNASAATWLLGVNGRSAHPQDHRIRVEVSSIDLSSGTGGATAVEYIPWHICHAEPMTHEVHHGPETPSRLTLPVIHDRAAFLAERATG